uniref:Aminopeptidase n=1 Tax=Panagrolaimus sp. JU765 TaxID=591449 RepID=A0AC34RAD9_9BILA
MLPYAVRFDIGDARAQALVYFSNLMSKCQTDPDFVKCNNVPKPIRTAVYCGAAIKGNIDTFMVLTGFLRSARTTYSFRNAEVKALVTGMACAQDQVSLTRYFNFAFSGGNLQPSDLMVLTSNPKAADALYDFVLNNFLTVTTLTDGLEYALGAITANWITPARAQQIQKLKDQLADQLDNKSKQLFDDAITSINIRSPTAMSDRAEIIRHFYDYYAPIGAIPWPKQLPQGMVKPISYDLTVQPYIPNKSYVYLAEKNFTYDGTVTVLFQALQNLQSIVLNSHRQVLASVIVTLPNQTNAQVPVTAVTRDYDHAFMTLTLGSTIQAGQFVQIVFTYSALSNTLEESVTNLKNGLVKTVFKKTNPMSSYLLALTIGHYSCVQSVSNVDKTLVRIWTWTGMEQYGQNALQFAIATVDYLSKTLNTPMPLEKFDVLALPQYSGSAYGAMENWGLVIAGYREVLFHPDYSFTEELAEIQDVVSHELTHHWFGDLVTMDWWTHLFLNEGFATFWPPRTLNATLPEQGNIAKQRIFAIHETGIRFDDNANSAHPVVPSNELFNNPNYNTFGVAVYYKAASIIATLRNVFGNDTAFYQGLSQYQQSHALSNSDDLGLWKSMNWVAQQIKTKDWMNSILNSTKMMLPLTYQWSAPEISVTSNGMNGFTLTQNPLAPRDSLPTSDYNYQWIVPFKTLSPGPVKSTVQWVYNSISSLPYSNPTPILNPEAETHARVLYDDASWASIYTTLKQNLTSIDEVTRAMLLADSWAFVELV